MAAYLILVRGLPGSGKTTFSNKIKTFLESNGVDCVHLETDQYFMIGDEYVFDKTKLGENHKRCQKDTKKHLLNGKWVIVANTFTTYEELKPYLQIARSCNVPFCIIEMGYIYESVHNVPEEAMTRMLKRYEDSSMIFDKMTPSVFKHYDMTFYIAGTEYERGVFPALKDKIG